MDTEFFHSIKIHYENLLVNLYLFAQCGPEEKIIKSNEILLKQH